MDLMSLMAKLTLDKTEYDQALESAEKAAQNMTIPPVAIPKPDNTEFEKGLKEAEETGSTFKEVMTGVWDGIKDAIVVTGITSAITSVIGYMRQGITMAAETGDAISKGAANLQLSTKAYQEYEYALGKSNIKITDLSKAMSAIDKIRGGDITEKQAKYFEELGISADEATSGVMSAEQILTGLMDSLADYGGSDKGAIIDAFFGKNDKWTGYFEQSAADVRALKKEADDLGMIMPDDAIKNAVEFNDATEKLSATLEGIQRSFGEGILPLITKAVEGVQKIIAFFSGGNESLAEMMAGDDKELAKQLTTIEGTSYAANEMIDKLFAMGDAEKFTAEQQAEWKSTAEWLVNNIPSLSGVIDSDTMSINGNKDAIKANIEEWKRLETERAVAVAKEKKQQQMLEANEEAIDKTATARAKANDALAKQGEMIAKANALLKDNEGLAAAFGNLFGTTEISGKAENLQDMLDWMNLSGFNYADVVDFQELLGEYNSLVKEQQTLEAEAEKYSDQLADAEKQYESWCTAIDELYGITSESAAGATDDLNGVTEAVNNIPTEKHVYIYTHHVDDDVEGSYAIGSPYIPYDQVAMLHRGERVLTATENRRGEGGGNVDYTQLENRIVAAIKAGMEGATVRSFLNGKDITDEVNRNNINAVKGRRFAT